MEYGEASRLDSAYKIARMACTVFGLNKRAEEYLHLVVSDIKFTPIAAFEVSHGAVDATVVEPSDIFKRILLSGGKNFVLIHNHPSGDVTPSESDINTTSRIKEGAKIPGLNFADHIIIGHGESYYSFRESVFW